MHLACVNVAALPLQILLRDHPEWRELPVAIVDKDKPQGIVQWVNKRAQAQCIRPGMRYAAALGLSTELRGGTVDTPTIQHATEIIQERLWAFSPRVESCEDSFGVFWLDASGLQPIFPSLPDWLSSIKDALHELGFYTSLTLGHSRFGTYAAAVSGRGCRVFNTPTDERRNTRGIAIDRIPMCIELRDLLAKLGVETLGAFCDLPKADIHTRFDDEAQRLHALAQGKRWAPLQPAPIAEPIRESCEFEYIERDLERILYAMEPLVGRVFQRLQQDNVLLRALLVTLALDDDSTVEECIVPAEPIAEERLLWPLIRLRLEQCKLSAGVVECVLVVESAELNERQLSLWGDTAHETLHNAGQAIAKVRASLGHDAVVAATPQDGHLPEAQYRWQPLDEVRAPRPTSPSEPTLVRRVYSPSRPLPSCTADDPDGWLIAGIAAGPVEEVVGPYRISGGWWMKDIDRNYFYVRTRNGAWYWIYHDRLRRRWFLQGEVQ